MGTGTGAGGGLILGEIRLSDSLGNFLSRSQARSSDSKIVRDSYAPAQKEKKGSDRGALQRLAGESALTLTDKVPLEPLEELERELVLRAERLLSDDSLHRGSVLSDGVLCVQLVGHIPVILPRQLLPDRRLHQPRQRREHVDGRVDLSVVELSVDRDLTLGNVTSKIGNRVGNVCRERKRKKTRCQMRQSRVQAAVEAGD